jgi:dienelactone hydrolase
MGTTLFDYDASAVPQITTKNRIRIQDVQFQSPTGTSIDAYLVAPSSDSDDPYPALLYVHWYEPHSPLSNRNQFLGEAAALANEGVVSLIVSTMWSEPKWFFERSLDDDHAATIRQVIDLRVAMDVLCAQPNVDTSRIGYVGHDFGAMFGSILAGIDGRAKTYVLAAGTPHFAHWYLLGQRDMPQSDKDAFTAKIEKFDPIHYIHHAAPSSVFLQFAHEDFYVPEEKVEAFFAAASEPKKLGRYDGGHGLNEDATIERAKWLREQLGFGVVESL